MIRKANERVIEKPDHGVLCVGDEPLELIALILYE